MQSTGHSSMHALSLTSTHGCAITYVTSLASPRWVPACPPALASGSTAGLLTSEPIISQPFPANLAGGLV
ncbi:hypothetical protein ARTHRO8AJ_140069 [Arthrobacter sp. 8AJ]|nr:hypothetical protein ARTHRO8AJ_140069 [Arthrobacter sp. 8AJ]